ncbi:MAG: DUF4399 domain-containing protein [Algiphilus sp.]
MTKVLIPVTLTAAALWLSACSPAQDSTEGDSAAAAPTEHSQHDGAKPAANETLPAGRQPAPANARVYIISPADGATVTSPVTIQFGLEGMGVAPAGMHKKHTGHHHLLVNVTDFPVDRPLPSSEQYIHFGGGQTQTALELEPGEHTLKLVMGDWKHQPHDPVVASKTITITVVEE